MLARAVRRSRARQSDAYALESSSAPSARLRAGRFNDEITPVTFKDAKGKEQTLTADEHPRAGSTIEGLRKLPLVFGREGSRASSPPARPPASPTAAPPSCS